jgi:YD repeat-containing protein
VAINQVRRDYDGIGNLTREWQAHTGGVYVAAPTPSIDYTYDMSANRDRLRSVTYPNGRVISYNYDSFGRVGSISDGAGATGAHLEEYSYLGLGTVLGRRHPETQVDLTVGLDAFGRVDDQAWAHHRAGAASPYVDRSSYFYDADSNLLAREDHVLSWRSEIFHPDGAAAATYDPLNRSTEYQRGAVETRSGSVPVSIAPVENLIQQWSANAQGNWSRSSSTDGINPGDRLTFQTDQLSQDTISAASTTRRRRIDGTPWRSRSTRGAT